jgi:protein deglycase
MAKVLVPLADGVEEMEAVIIVDVLRRAGWHVVTAAVRAGLGAATGAPLTASRGMRLLADTEWAEVSPKEFDALVLPGGAGGTKVLRGFPPLLETIRQFQRAGKWTCAVCAAPLVLQDAGILRGRPATCHPGVRGELTEADLTDKRVVIDGRIITSQGPGTTFEFALALIREVDGATVADRVSGGLVL